MKRNKNKYPREKKCLLLLIHITHRKGTCICLYYSAIETTKQKVRRMILKRAVWMNLKLLYSRHVDTIEPFFLASLKLHWDVKVDTGLKFSSFPAQKECEHCFPRKFCSLSLSLSYASIFLLSWLSDSCAKRCLTKSTKCLTLIFFSQGSNDWKQIWRIVTKKFPSVFLSIRISFQQLLSNW